MSAAGIGKGKVADFLNESLDLFPKGSLRCSTVAVPVVDLDGMVSMPLASYLSKSVTGNSTTNVTDVVPVNEIWDVARIWHVPGDATNDYETSQFRLYNLAGGSMEIFNRTAAFSSCEIPVGAGIRMIGGQKFVFTSTNYATTADAYFYCFGKKWKVSEAA